MAIRFKFLKRIFKSKEVYQIKMTEHDVVQLNIIKKGGVKKTSVDLSKCSLELKREGYKNAIKLAHELQNKKRLELHIHFGSIFH